MDGCLYLKAIPSYQKVTSQIENVILTIFVLRGLGLSIPDFSTTGHEIECWAPIRFVVVLPVSESRIHI
jgi:hypothetical protein